MPKVLFRGQGGLSDIVLHQEYNNNGRIYFSYSAYIDEKKKLNTLFVDRAKIENFKFTRTELGVQFFPTAEHHDGFYYSSIIRKLK